MYHHGEPSPAPSSNFNELRCHLTASGEINEKLLLKKHGFSIDKNIGEGSYAVVK